MLFLSPDNKEQYLFIVNDTKESIYIPTFAYNFLIVSSDCFDIPEALLAPENQHWLEIKKKTFIVASYRQFIGCTFYLFYKDQEEYDMFVQEQIDKVKNPEKLEPGIKN